MIKRRRSQVQDLLHQHRLDAVLFFHPPNLRYLCGFTGTDGVLVVDGAGSVFLTDSRYTTQARDQVSADEVREYSVKLDGIVDFLKQSTYHRLGFEADTLPFSTVERLRGGVAAKLELVPVGKELQGLRQLKDAGEIAALEQAGRIAAEAFEAVRPMLRPGVAEREIALELEFALRRLGAEDKAFDFIVASGERGALPHGVASDKLLRRGELVTIDFGCRYQGYHSDETVTLSLGPPTERMREVFDIVLQAHDLALEQVRPGLSLRQLDKIAREYIAGRGYADYFGHGLGHGVGLEIHEPPAVSPRAEALLEEGMVITIEPGIYLPGVGGVRIEDMLVVTAEGPQVLTRLPKQLQQL